MILAKQARRMLGDYLKNYRISAGLTQSEIASKLKLSSAQYVSNIERGQAEPSIETLKIWVELCNIDPDEVISAYEELAELTMRQHFYEDSE